MASTQEEAEIIIAYRLSPQRPRAIANINRRDNHSTISSLSSGNALAAPPSPVPSILPSNTGTTTPTSTSVSHSGARPQDRLSEAARRCQEWVETRRGDLHLSVLSSAPVNPQYPPGGAAREASATITTKFSHTSEHVRRGTVKGDAKSVLPTDPQGGLALVYDEAVGGWGKKSLTESGLSLTGRDPMVRETPGYSRAPEGTESLLLVPDRLQTAEQPDGCFLRRRESHMTVTSVITIEDPEQTRLNELRAEREREKKVEEQELRERNKKKPPLRLLSLDGGGTRGYTMILLLEELMHQCFVSIHGRAPDARKGERPPKPCEIFDLIGGTGIGGVIGIFLGRLRLSVAELKDMYPSLMQSILQQNKRMFGVPFRSTLFKASKLVDTLRTTIRQQRVVTDSELPKDPFDSDEEGPPGEPFGWTINNVTCNSKYRRSPVTPNSLVSAATFCESTGVAPKHQNHAQRRKSLDDASEAWMSFSDSSDKGCKGLFRGGFAKKKSLNDLRASQATSVAASEVPPVPKVDSKHLDDPTTEGHPDEILYDARAGRCRTFVTAILKGSFYDQDPALLRSYSSPAEALLEPKCAIWQACAATTAVQIMFKPVQIGQHIFHDEGPSSYNPTPSVLKEAAEHLWRGREIGCITSIGTGKVGSASSPEQAHSAERWEGIGSGIASFAAARKRLALKLDACETVHREVEEKILRHYGVLNDDYFRFNVDLGWATSDLCEWESLAELNTMTKRYLGKVDVHDAIKECGRRLGALQKMKEKMIAAMPPKQQSPTQNSSYDYGEPPYFKAELPADEPISSFRPAVVDHHATYAELPTEEAIPHSNREFFPPKSLPRNFPGKRETFYIVSELPFFDKPPTSGKGCAEMNVATNSSTEPRFEGELLRFGFK